MIHYSKDNKFINNERWPGHEQKLSKTLKQQFCLSSQEEEIKPSGLL